MEKAFAIPISRRDFMKLAGLTAASSLLGIKDDAVKAEAAPPAISALDYSKANLPILFNVDVCVVGGCCYRCAKRSEGCPCGAGHFPWRTGDSRMCVSLHAYFHRWQ